ncbi:MAG: extracellular solute-binding protein [Anaerolineae bacterium]|nr:MAG: extracellular solute-binding protein [Anaerolineae bacterium]
MVLAACQPQVVTKTVEVEKVVTQEVVVTKEVQVEKAVPTETIVFWSTENQPARAERTQKIIDRFTEQTGIGVELVLVDENAIDSLMAANQAAGTMPDVVFFPLDFAATWYAQGVLDADAATAAVQDLDPSTFSEGALSMVSTGDGKYMAVPSDGWGQLLIYRKDLFDQLGLEPPTDFDKIMAAAQALKDAGYIGIMAGTDPGQVFTQQCFEHFALANGVQLTDAEGNVTLDTPQMVEALDFYTTLMRDYGPGDTATYWLQARASYFAGEAGMVVWSPFILDEMAGLRDSVLPNCPECADDIAYLAKNSGVVPAFSGPSGGPAQYGQVSYMGITTGANAEAAKQFVEFWLTDGYLDWVGVAAEGKFPMRRGTPDEPNKFLEGWGNLEVGVDRRAPLSDFYSADVLSTIIEGANNFDRWGFAQGQGELVGAIYSELPVPQVIADIIEGNMTAEEGATELQAMVEEIQAGLSSGE